MNLEWAMTMKKSSTAKVIYNCLDCRLAGELAAAEAMLDEQHEKLLDFDYNPSDVNEYTLVRMCA